MNPDTLNNSVQKYKSLFVSRTFWSATVAYAMSVFPHLQTIISNGLSEDIVIAILTLTVPYLSTVFFRHQAKTIVTTPAILPGRNLPSTEQR